jgi:hypothetical protein
MIRIAEELGFMKVRAVMVCAKVGLRRKTGHRKICLHAHFRRTASEKTFLVRPRCV